MESEHPHSGPCVQENNIRFTYGNTRQDVQCFGIQRDLLPMTLCMRLRIVLDMVRFVVQENPGAVFKKTGVNYALQQNRIGLICPEQFTRR